MENVAKLEEMYKGRFSNPVKHKFFEFVYGYLLKPCKIEGYLRNSEGAMLYKWASLIKPNSKIVEIGCFNGLSTSFLAKGAEKSKSKVYSIDPFHLDLDRQLRENDGSNYIHKKRSKNEVELCLKRCGLDGYVELIEGFSLDIAKNWSQIINFLWLDGNHNQIRQDYETWRKFLINGSRVAFHDAHPKYGRENIADYVRSVIEKEVITDLEQVKSIISFIIHK